MLHSNLQIRLNYFREQVFVLFPFFFFELDHSIKQIIPISIEFGSLTQNQPIFKQNKELKINYVKILLKYRRQTLLYICFIVYLMMISLLYTDHLISIVQSCCKAFKFYYFYIYQHTFNEKRHIL